jgi:hypothetical protein
MIANNNIISWLWKLAVNLINVIGDVWAFLSTPLSQSLSLPSWLTFLLDNFGISDFTPLSLLLGSGIVILVGIWIVKSFL